MNEKGNQDGRILIYCAAVLILVALLYPVLSFLDNHVATLFLNSRIERLEENGLPKASIEHGNTVYCRMKADDFRFTLPAGARATNLIITNGGFDTVYGSVEIYFGDTGQNARFITSSWPGQVQSGGRVTSEPIPGGFMIRFEYFGDK